MVVSNIFYFHPYLGKWSNLTTIFQMGWNHQLDMFVGDFSCYGSFFNIFLIKNMTVLKWHGLKNPRALECVNSHPTVGQWVVAIVVNQVLRRYVYNSKLLFFFLAWKTEYLRNFTINTSIQLPFPFLWLLSKSFRAWKNAPAPCTQH